MMDLRLLRILSLIVPTIAGLGPRAEAAEGLTATAEITQRAFCLGTPSGLVISERMLAADAVSLSIQVRVSYRNGGLRPTILLRSDNRRIVLSRTLEDAAQHRNQVVIPYYEFEPRRPWEPEDLPLLDSERPGPQFEVLPSRGTWTDEPARLSFQVHKPSTDGTGSELLGRKVFFQLELDHALLAGDLASTLQAKWRPYGTLWVGTIRTQPIELNIPQSPEAARCGSKERID